VGATCVGSGGCSGLYACVGTNITCVECQSPGVCQKLPGTCTSGTCSYTSVANGTTCASAEGGVCGVCALGACTGTLLCTGGGQCNSILGCL
jgi:hypothetical protein